MIETSSLTASEFYSFGEEKETQIEVQRLVCKFMKYQKIIQRGLHNTIALSVTETSSHQTSVT